MQKLSVETDEQREWLADLFGTWTEEIVILSPSEWAEEKRYLPPSVTPVPGFYRFNVAPYLREIVDCLSVNSPVRHLAVMKGVQVCMTVGVLENFIGYSIDHVRDAPVMLVTADAELAKLRMESYITPMLQHSKLDHLIKSADEKNTRKTGKTDRKIEWIGGGFLIPFGAQNANKLRSISIRFLLRDEIDAWPDVVGKDGDPIKLSTDRTATYENTRKIADLSTPLIKGQSKIASQFEQGDQRYYFVRCLACRHPQILRWRHTDPKTGEVSGITWESKKGVLVPGSVRYLCQECGHAHTNADKSKLLSPDHGAEWRPTAEPKRPNTRSYHLSALYSPPEMQSWEACVSKWLEAWDEEHNRPRDLGALQVFYNNVLGEPFEVRGEKLRFETVSAHRRRVYSYGEIPNEFAVEFCGSPVLVLTCAVDVHKENLKVAVFGWTRERRPILIDYWHFEGDTEQLDDPETWGKLREIIEEKEYIADDGKRYRPQLTLIDSGYRADHVYRFCDEYESNVYPVKGRETPTKAAIVKEFSEFTTPLGTRAFNITVDLYKDRLSAALRRAHWSGQDMLPVGAFSAPIDITDKQLKELTVETKREKLDKATGKRVGFEWHRPSGAANELWDLLVYNSAALDMLGWNICLGALKLEAVHWPQFYEYLENERPFFSE